MCGAALGHWHTFQVLLSSGALPLLGACRWKLSPSQEAKWFLSHGDMAAPGRSPELREVTVMDLSTGIVNHREQILVAPAIICCCRGVGAAHSSVLPSWKGQSCDEDQPLLLASSHAQAVRAPPQLQACPCPRAEGDVPSQSLEGLSTLAIQS